MNRLDNLLSVIDKINESTGYTTDNFKTDQMLESDPLKKTVYYIKTEKNLHALNEILETTQKRIDTLKKQQELNQ